MNKKKLKDKLIKFETRIADLYEKKKIKGPIHLSGNNENQLIKIFKKINKQDWVFVGWRNHYHALLKGCDQKKIEMQIINGKSMTLNSYKDKFFSSSIVGGVLPIALGVSLSLKRKKSKSKVWVFIGDMTYETGVFYECYKYSRNMKLPLKIVVEDNNLSTNTPTKKHGKETKETPRVITLFLQKKISSPWYWKMDFILMTYLNQIQKSMNYLSKKKNVIFLGQSVIYPGSSIFVSLKDVPIEKKIEMPVMEEVQMGISIGLALDGYIPVSCYPRFDFLVLAFNQLINHADKIDYLTNNSFKSKIIVRTLVGSTKPLNAGLQHTQDHTQALKKMMNYSEVIKINKKERNIKNYKKAISKKSNKKIFVFIEDGNQYI